MQAKYGENEIKSLLQKVRIFNKAVGSYEVFAITENFDYAVKVSNGRILLKLDELQNDEHESLSPLQLTSIANRFVSSESHVTQQEDHINQQSRSEIPTQGKNGSGGKILLTVVIVLIIIFTALGLWDNFSQGDDHSGAGDSYREKVMTVEEIERSKPSMFLNAAGTYRENFWGNKIKVSCVIKNNATVATYKDAVVRITYYTKTKTNIGSKDYTIYEIFPPHSTKTVELKIDKYQNVGSIGWEVLEAVAY